MPWTAIDRYYSALLSRVLLIIIQIVFYVLTKKSCQGSDNAPENGHFLGLLIDIWEEMERCFEIVIVNSLSHWYLVFVTLLKYAKSIISKNQKQQIGKFKLTEITAIIADITDKIANDRSVILSLS